MRRSRSRTAKAPSHWFATFASTTAGEKFQGAWKHLEEKGLGRDEVLSYLQTTGGLYFLDLHRDKRPAAEQRGLVDQLQGRVLFWTDFDDIAEEDLDAYKEGQLDLSTYAPVPGLLAQQTKTAQRQLRWIPLLEVAKGKVWLFPEAGSVSAMVFSEDELKIAVESGAKLCDLRSSCCRLQTWRPAVSVQKPLWLATKPNSEAGWSSATSTECATWNNTTGCWSSTSSLMLATWLWAVYSMTLCVPTHCWAARDGLNSMATPWIMVTCCTCTECWMGSRDASFSSSPNPESPCLCSIFLALCAAVDRLSSAP